jgi:hypothetical protein
MAPDGFRLLTLDALSVQTALDGCRRIVWMIIGMIKAHPIRIGCQGKQAPIESNPAAVLDRSMSQIGTDTSAE